jgi:hypothetical protein
VTDEVFVGMLKQQVDTAKSKRNNFMHMWQQVADYGLGRREFIAKVNPGRPRQIPIYDGTFQHSSDAMVAAVQAMVFNQATQWAWIVPEDPELAKDEEVMKYYQQMTEVVFKIFNHPEACFPSTITESVTDWVNFGNCCIYTDQDDTGIYFQAMPLNEMIVDINCRGLVDTFYREFTYTAKQAVDEFAEHAGTGARKAFADQKFDEPFMFIHAVLPRGLFPSRPPANDSHEFLSIYANITDGEIVREKGYTEQPFSFARYNTDAGEIYGRGPGINAISDAKMLNRMRKTRISAAEKGTDPVILQSDDGVMGNVKTHPGARIIIRDTGSRTIPPVSYLESRARFDISDVAFDQTREQVRAHFSHELLETIADPRMTATQIIEIGARSAQKIGPPVLRLQSELGEQTLRRVVGLADRAGKFDHIAKPDRLAGVKFAVDYVSPAMKAQLSADAQAVMTSVNTGMQWAQGAPEVLDNFDMDKSIRILTEALGDAAKILRSNGEVRRIRQTRAAREEEQRQLEQLEKASQVAKNAAPAVDALAQLGGEGQPEGG